jgi:hypothetical protein
VGPIVAHHCREHQGPGESMVVHGGFIRTDTVIA